MVVIVQSKQAAQFSNRILVIVHPQIDVAVVITARAAILPDDENRRRLRPAAIAPRAVSSQECRD